MTDDAAETRTDADLVAAARKGEEIAFDLLVRRHHAAVYRVALSILRDPDEAADAAQEAFIKAFGALDGFRGDAAFRTWLLSIAANQARGTLRKVKRRSAVPLEAVSSLRASGPTAFETLSVREELARVVEALATLPEKQRLTVSLRLYEGMSYREVGEIVGSSEGAARVNYHHGIRRLRDLLEKL